MGILIVEERQYFVHLSATAVEYPKPIVHYDWTNGVDGVPLS